MSKTGAWVLELEEQFWDKCEDFIKSNQDVSQAMADAVQYNKEHMYLNLEEDVIEEGISEMWNDYWSEYQ
tara:strand:+ start:74 stop:283 length:210 start_codon:yes stop_codon:yes gene_type:complete